MAKKRKGKSPEPSHDDDDGSDHSDDEEEADLRMEDHDEKKESLSVDFGFFDPKPSDFHGMRALLASGGANSLLPSAYEVGSLADAVSEQAAVGSVVKVIAPNSEEPAEPDDVLGFLTAVNLRSHRDNAFAKQLKASLTQRCSGDSKAKERLASLLADEKLGVLVSSRMVNLPAALLPSLVDSLLQDIKWAVKEAEPVAERASYDFSRLLLLATVEVNKDVGGEGSSSADGDAGGVGGGSSGGGKKRKKMKAAALAAASAAQLEGLTFARMEEEVLAAAADWSVLLNGSGKTRQLLLVLSLEAMRQAVPAIHGMVSDD